MLKPIEEMDFWGDCVKKEDLEKYDIFLSDLQQEANNSLENILNELGSFFNVPSDKFKSCLPKIMVQDIIAGSSAKYFPDSNTIFFPCKYAFPVFLGQTDDLKKTHFYSALSHETGHFFMVANLYNRNQKNFVNVYDDVFMWTWEFFSRICQKRYCENNDLYLKKAKLSEFEKKDPHISYVYADFHYNRIKKLSKTERNQLANNPKHLLKYKSFEI